MIRVYGIKEHLEVVREQLSDVINTCMVGALQFPENKRAHRFIGLDSKDFYYPEGRTDAYTVIEISLMQGRSESARKDLIHMLFNSIEEQLGIDPIDVEITLYEVPACNWGFRGITGDKAKLDYDINV